MLLLRLNAKSPNLVYYKSLREEDSTWKGKSVVADDLPMTMLHPDLGILCLLVKLSNRRS